MTIYYFIEKDLTTNEIISLCTYDNFYPKNLINENTNTILKEITEEEYTNLLKQQEE